MGQKKIDGPLIRKTDNEKKEAAKLPTQGNEKQYIRIDPIDLSKEDMRNSFELINFKF